VAGLIACALGLVLPACHRTPVASAAAAADGVRGQIVAAARDKPELAGFYRDHDGRPLWIAENGANPAARRLIDLLQGAAADGLDPARYDPAALRGLASSAGRDPARLARLEVALSRAFIAYIGDLRRPSDAAAPFYVDPGLEREKRPRKLLEAAAAAPSLSDYLAQVRQMHPVYEALRAALAATPEGGDADMLRKRRAILASMDRARALPAMLPRHVLVDAASARLWLFEGRRPVDSMRVVVGKQRMQTPALAALIRFAVVNPYWNLPPDLIRERARRVLRGGPEVLERERMELLSDWTPTARVLDAGEVDWQVVAENRAPLRMRQLPGPDNMMGAIKFMLPNRLGIYLHDTPEKDAFTRDDRRLSSGCVRVEDAPRLARWLFGGSAPQDAGMAEQRVDLPAAVPVYITYLTALPAHGGVALVPDRYGRDPALLAELAHRGVARG
jgi:murein L,D-transpeptidase YcbB/YkuD